MTSTNDPVFRVLDKLRDAVIAGKHRAGLMWEYELSDSYQEEDTAIQMLETRGVIATVTGDSKLKVHPEGQIEYQGTVSPSDTENWSRHIESVNTSAYEKICTEYGLEPYRKTYIAELELKDETVPLVTVGSFTYKLPALHSGMATDVIVYAYKHNGRGVLVKELRESAGVSQLSNIKDSLRAGLFATGSMLSPFANMSSHSITLVTSAVLDEKQLARISSHPNV